MARLVLLSEGYTGRTYELKGEKTTVGLVSDNAFEIPESSVSSHHAEIILPGQILRLGTIEMRLETPESAAATAAAPAKKAAPLDHTRVIPQGVKLDGMEGTRGVEFSGKSGFEKKSNKGTKIFIIGAVVVGVLLVGLLIFLVVNK